MILGRNRDVKVMETKVMTIFEQERTINSFQQSRQVVRSVNMEKSHSELTGRGSSLILPRADYDTGMGQNPNWRGSREELKEDTKTT